MIRIGLLQDNRDSLAFRRSLVSFHFKLVCEMFFHSAEKKICIHSKYFFSVFLKLVYLKRFFLIENFSIP